MRAKPLLLLAPSLSAAPGGIQTLTRDLVEALRELFPDRPTVVVTKLDKDAQLASCQYGSATRLRGVGDLPAFARSCALFLMILRCCAFSRPELLLVVHRNHAPIALIMKWLFGVPYVCMLHGVEAWKIPRWWHRKALQKASRLWCISQVTLDRVGRELGVAEGHRELLPCTADEQRFTPGERPRWLLERHGLGDEAKIVLTVARLASIERSKGYDRVLRAMPEVIARVPTAHYVLVGKGEDAERVKQLRAQLGVADQVTLAGFVEEAELPDYYRLCDVFALPSAGEGFGIVFLEALLSGKPCVGGADDGSREPLRGGALGALVDVDDRAQLVDALVAALTAGGKDAPRLRNEAVKHFGKARFRERLKEALARVGVAP